MRAALMRDPLFKKGLRVREAVLGGDNIRRRIAAADRYTEGFEEITTKAAWGIIWSRPGISRRIRSFINLGILTAIGQPQELRLHIRAALRNGLSRAEVAEALLHCSVYCGMPRVADARRAMVAVFEEMKAEKKRGARRSRR